MGMYNTYSQKEWIRIYMYSYFRKRRNQSLKEKNDRLKEEKARRKAGRIPNDKDVEKDVEKAEKVKEGECIYVFCIDQVFRI